MSFITTVTSPGIAGVGYPVLPSAKIVVIPATALTSGENDIYTAPAGKRASVSLALINLSGGAVNQTIQLKSGGNYFQLNPLTSAANNSNTLISNAFNTSASATAATLTLYNSANTYASLAATGFYNVASDNAAAGQVAWIQSLVELPV